MENYQRQLAEWIEKEYRAMTQKNENGVIVRRKRTYRHFDFRAPISRFIDFSDYATRTVEPHTVTKHAFYPFIRRIQASTKRIYLNKDRSSIRQKKRPIDYAAHSDALIYSWYAYQISSRYENILAKKELGANVIAYRSLGEGLNNLDHAKNAIDFWISNDDYVIIALDVSNFFGAISHAKLKKCLSELIESKNLPDDWYAVFKSVTRYSFVMFEKLTHFFNERKRGRDTRICTPEEMRRASARGLVVRNSGKVGIPQGSPISCILANLYLLGFDEAVSLYTKKVGGYFRRYSDDILLIVPRSELMFAEQFITEKLREYDLSISEAKTERYILKKHDMTYSCVPLRKDGTDETEKLGKKFGYLGVMFDGTNFFLREKGVSKMYRKMEQSVRIAREFAEKAGLHRVPGKALYNKYITPKQNYLAYRDMAVEKLAARSVYKQVSSKNIAHKLKARKIEEQKKLDIYVKKHKHE